jgi:hypothetical protein
VLFNRNLIYLSLWAIGLGLTQGTNAQQGPVIQPVDSVQFLLNEPYDLLHRIYYTGNVSASQPLISLSEYPQQSFFRQINSDSLKITFWLNAYNALVQYELLAHPERFHHRNRFFTEKRYTLFGQRLSLDDIEHRILRRNAGKYSLGYMKRFSRPAFYRKAVPASLDYRVHFAMNCGAASCPPITLFEPDQLYNQLEQRTSQYLKDNTLIKGSTAYLPRLLFWFKGDFGSRRNVKQLLEKHQVTESGKKYRLRYLPYDWTMKKGNFDRQQPD